MSKSPRDLLKEAMDAKHRFIAKNTDPEGGEPLCGYADWDEAMADRNETIANLAESLFS